VGECDESCKKCAKTCGPHTTETCYSCNWLEKALEYRDACATPEILAWSKKAVGDHQLCKPNEGCLLRGLLEALLDADLAEDPTKFNSKFDHEKCAAHMVLSGDIDTSFCGTKRTKYIFERSAKCFSAVDTLLSFFKNTAMDKYSPVYEALNSSCSSIAGWSEQGPKMLENALIVQRSVFRTIVEMLSSKCHGATSTTINNCSVSMLVSAYNKDLFKTGIDAPKPANKCQNTGDDEDCTPGCPDTHCSTEFSTCVKPVGLPDLCSHRQRIARCAEEHDSNAEDPCIAGMACVECNEDSEDFMNCNMCARDCQRSAREDPEGLGNQCWYESCSNFPAGMNETGMNNTECSSTTTVLLQSSGKIDDTLVSLLSSSLRLGNQGEERSMVGWDCG